uniref:Uncharacterized protein n=1 Tax=Setaria italica TaxID=4555 RepID=K3Z1E6_SETIT
MSNQNFFNNSNIHYLSFLNNIANMAMLEQINRGTNLPYLVDKALSWPMMTISNSNF